MLLDRVQKNIMISKQQSDILRKAHLIEGRYPNIYVSKGISEIVNDKVSYTKNSGFNDQYYKDFVIKHINKSLKLLIHCYYDSDYSWKQYLQYLIL